MSRLILRRAAATVLALLAVVAVGACSTSPTGSASTNAQSGSTAGQSAIAITHVHGVARDPRTGDVLLATHEGLFRQTGGELRRSSPVIDLMGFAVAPDGTFYASGHPGVGVDLPQPVGLITSTDGGRTWRVVSRGGESDFHALTVGPTTVIGFDGTLRTSTDRRTWTARSISSPPRTLATSPTTGRLLATTEAGLLSSADDGASWCVLNPPETAVLAAWADDETVVALTTAGRLATSHDQGVSWVLHPNVVGTAGAMHAQRTPSGDVEVLLVIDGKVVRTIDGGATTTKLLA